MPFSELLVLELASVLAGPSVGQFLAEFGAEVVKIENAAAEGDVTRRWALPEEDASAERPAYFAAANWGKRSIALDLTREEGRRVLHDLARQADIAVASYKPGDAERLGADARTLCALNPRLIHASIVGYGEDDPRAGYDAVVQAEAGFTFMNGEAGGPPTKLPVALIDVLAAHQLKEAILVALLRRERTGEGAALSVSLLQAGVAALVNQATNYLVAGHVPQRLGSEHPNIAPYGTAFGTADGTEVVLAVGTDRQFAALCEVLGVPELASAPQFATNHKRVRNRLYLAHLLRERIGTWRRAELLRALAARHIPAGAVNDMAAVFEQPAARALVLEDAGSGLAGLRHVAFRLGGEPPPLAPPPRYAEHTRAVLADRLGYPPEDIERLTRSGAAVARDP